MTDAEKYLRAKTSSATNIDALMGCARGMQMLRSGRSLCTASGRTDDGSLDDLVHAVDHAQQGAGFPQRVVLGG